MALELILKLNSITADCGQLTLDDETIYGGTESERNTLALLVAAYKKGLASEVDMMLEVVSINTNPATNTSWSVTSQNDGWHSFPMFAVPLYDVAVTYTLDQCVYHSSAVWKCLASAIGIEPGTNPAFWQQQGIAAGAIIDLYSDTEQTAIEEIIAALEAASNVEFDYINYILTCRSEKCYAKVVVAAANNGCCQGCSDAELKQTYERLDVLLNATFSLCTQLKYAQAEEVVRNMVHICEKSKCICD